MTKLCFIRDGWLDGLLDDENEAATFVRLKVTVGHAILSRTFSERGGGESETLNVPLVPLASYLARMWWPLLFEPLRAKADDRFRARHRLDVPMHGYVFPALAICSAGDEALVVDWAQLDSEHSPLKFLTASPREPLQLARDQAEPELMNLVESAIDRLSSSSPVGIDLREDWERVRESMSSSGQLASCVAAGRLGLDPYDPDGPDIGSLAEDLSPDLLNDISDAVDISTLQATTAWTAQARSALKNCPRVNVEEFGARPIDDLQSPAWAIGVTAARELRARLGLYRNKPYKAVGDILGQAAYKSGALSESGPGPMTALVRRTNGVANIGAVAQSARQQRFRACAATYIAWCSQPGDERAGTNALTRRQQASRSFAAEMLAPQEYLWERGSDRGFTGDELEEQAGELTSPYETVLWQAWRAGIRLWDVDIPPPKREGLFG